MDEHGTKVWTYDDLASLPDDQRYEIIDGELYVSPAPTRRHQLVAKRLMMAFLELEKQRIATVWFAPLDLILSPTRVVQPDLMVVRWGRQSIVAEHGIVGPPDIVVEVLSPSTTKHDRTTKRRFYARNRIPEYWLVDPEAESVELLRLLDDGLSYRQAGWFGAGDRIRIFDLELDVGPLFAPNAPEHEAIERWLDSLRRMPPEGDSNT